MRKKILPRSLKFKVGWHLGIALILSVSLFAYLMIRHHRDELLRNAIEHLNNTSEIIIRSTRYAMLQNHQDMVFRIIGDIGLQENIEKVRILSKEGLVIHSTFGPEINTTIDKKAEGCFTCHQEATPLEKIPHGKRARTFREAGGGHFLASMTVIRNEFSCSTTGCHVPPEERSILGILDVVYSLENIDERIRSNSIAVAILSLGLIVTASLLVSFFIYRLVYLPLRDLEAGSKRLSAGNLDELIPVRSRDEFGHLAASFNGMTLTLKDSKLELQKWARLLEQKVEVKTEELQIAEAETERADRLASVGLLAAGIAHELNNPLTGILTFSNLLRQKVAGDSPEAEDLDLVIRETKRCAVIIKRLLDFSREKAPEMDFSDLNETVRETVQLVAHQAGFHNVHIDLNLDPDLPPVWMDANQMKQVFMNIIVNAIEAIDGGGTVTIESRLAPGPGSSTPERISAVEVRVTDSGCGIRKDNLKKVFDPFFTSKEVGQGTGLGLSVSYGIVKGHGGDITVESEEGTGTTFSVTLPLKTETPQLSGVIHERQDTDS